MMRRLIGTRSGVRREVNDVINEVKLRVEAAVNLSVASNLSVSDVKHKFAAACASYYALAAASRRKHITENDRKAAFSLLYWSRSALESEILRHIDACTDIKQAALTDSFFGRSSKQGVSIRYPLSSCVPTKDCGARCYAHDGRDREIHLLFRGVLNYWVGSTYESASAGEKAQLMDKLIPIARKAIASANQEVAEASEDGFNRSESPRISWRPIGLSQTATAVA